MRFSHRGGSVVCKHMSIKTFKTRTGWAIDKWFQLISITMLFKTVKTSRIQPFQVVKNIVCVAV